VRDPDADPTLIPGLVVDAVGRHFALGLVRKVLRPDALGLPFRFPFLPGILVIADQFLLLGVYRDDRLAAPLERAHPAVDILELRVAVGVVRTLLGLTVDLQVVAQVVQQTRYRLVTHRVALADQRLGQVADTFTSPQ